MEYPKVVVESVSVHTRNVKSPNLGNVVFIEPEIDIAFPTIVSLSFVNLYRCQRPRFGFAFHFKYNTMNTDSKLLTDDQVVAVAVFM